jgi:hypothetical protein
MEGEQSTKNILDVRETQEIDLNGSQMVGDIHEDSSDLQLVSRMLGGIPGEPLVYPGNPLATLSPGNPSPGMSYQMIPRTTPFPTGVSTTTTSEFNNKFNREKHHKKEIVIDAVFFTILDHCIDLLRLENTTDISRNNICKIYCHLLRYIYNTINIKGINTREEFDNFLGEMTSGEYLKVIKENGQKMSDDHPNELLGGPICEYLFPLSTNELEDRIKDVNYAVACVEFLCCQILFGFKGKSTGDIERLLEKISVK